MIESAHIKIQLACTFIQPILWTVCLAVSRMEQSKIEGGIDNSNPRGTRALSAHTNLLEGFVWFGFAILTNIQLSTNEVAGTVLALIYLLCRLVYVPLYLFNYPTARSLIWNLGFLATLALFLVPFA